MRKLVAIATLFVLLLVVTACGLGEKKEDSNANENAGTVKDVKEAEIEDTSFEITDASGQTLVFESVPTSIATLSTGDLDMLTALGANVTGRPTASGPVDSSIESIPELGNPHQPNFEKIAEVHPDVLIAGMSFKQHAENIERQGTKVLYTNTNSIADIQDTIDMYGELLKKQIEAQEINKTITEKIKASEENTNPGTKTLLVYGAPGTYLVALPNSLSGDILEKAGGENIASDFPAEDDYPQYASLSVEKIIERNPEVVMLITHGEPEAVKAAFEEEMEKSAAWKNLDAVKNGKVVVLPSHLFGSNPGTKITEALDVMIESLTKGN